MIPGTCTFKLMPGKIIIIAFKKRQAPCGLMSMPKIYFGSVIKMKRGKTN